MQKCIGGKNNLYQLGIMQLTLGGTNLSYLVCKSLVVILLNDKNMGLYSWRVKAFTVMYASIHSSEFYVE